MGKETKKLFGVAISDKVNSQLESRKALLAKEEKSAQEVMLLSNRGAWVRMTSGINVVPLEKQEDYNYLKIPNIADSDRKRIISDLKKVGNTDALENILMGGTMSGKEETVSEATDDTPKRIKYKLSYRTGFLPNNDIGSYDQSPEYGYRPMAGITGFKVKSKSAYGALKEVEISIKVNSRDQLDMVDKLYLRPGYDMLVEWGSSIYLDKNNEVNVDVKRKVLNSFLSANSPATIAEQIEQQKTDSGYNYDAIVGKVINFDWSYNTDGTYDCTVKLMTKGEIMESISSNKHATTSNPLNKISKKNTGAGSSDIDSKDTISIMLNSLRYLKEDTLKDVKKLMVDGDKLIVIRSDELKGETSSGSGDEEEKSKNYHWYVPLRDLLSCLNQFFIDKDNDGEPAIRFSTDFSSATYVTNKLHISSDPGICAIPYSGSPTSKLHRNGGAAQTVRDLYGGVLPTKFQRAYNQLKSKHGEEFKKASPLSILVNVDNALDIQKAFLEEKKNNLSKEQVIYSYVKKILDDISTALGGINILDLHHDIENNEWVVVDRNTFGPSEEKEPLPRIDIIGLKSFVTNFGLSSKISNAIASQLAIGATASGLKQRGMETLLKYNEELINRYDFSPPFGTTMTVEDEEDELFDIIRTVGNAYMTYFAGRTYAKSEFKDLAIDYSNFIETYGAMERRIARIEKKPTFYPGLLPLDLNITMDGIAGLKIGEAFTINPVVLPKRYLDKVAFVITQIEHSIGGDNRWETDITCKMFNLPSEEVATEREARKKEEAKTKSENAVTDNKGKNGWLTPSSHPWSAAFISYVAKKGYSGFPGKTSHTAYAQALRSDSNWEILDASKTLPKVGDIVLKPRAGNKVNFTDSKYKGSSHSDIVVAVNGRKYTIIGGNVGNTVKKQQKTANTGGYESPWVIVMRPKTASVNIQAMISACESEWRFWHLSQNDRDNQRRDRESAANVENSRGDALLTRLDSYWSAASTNWGGQITREA